MPNNNISLTVRLPRSLSEELKTTAKKLGMTKTNLIRISILQSKEQRVKLSFPSDNSFAEKDRIVLNINEYVNDVLSELCEDHNQSMNTIIIAACFWGVEYYSKLLKGLGL